MDTHKHHSSGDEFASILERESLQESSAVNKVLTYSNQEQMGQFYAPRPTVPQPPYITGSFPQNAAYSAIYFMPPYQTAPLQHAMSPCNLPITFINPQSPIPGLRQIAPKQPQAENPVIVACSSVRPPDFIETVKQIRKELYAHGGISEDQNPPVLETKDYSQWRKDVIQRWKPVS